MTADSAADAYGDVSGLVERSAASYAASVPEDPADDGFFGPRSVTWRLSNDLSGRIGGLRSLMIQALHPLAMAGVAQHSDWRQDPVGRLSATQSYVTTVSVGDRATAERVSERVRRIHEHVRGTDPDTGQPYAAGDPGLLLWVHAALVDSTIAAVRMFGAGLSGPDADRYVAEMVAAAELVGIPRAMVPASVAARESMAYLLDPPGLDPDVAEIWQDVREGTIASLPDWVRDLYGYQLDSPLTGERRTA